MVSPGCVISKDHMPAVNISLKLAGILLFYTNYVTLLYATIKYIIRFSFSNNKSRDSLEVSRLIGAASCI